MFTGVLPAVVTPFKNGKVDEEGLRQLIEFHLENGVHGIVPCGTTGESATLSHDEHERVVEITVDQVNGRVPVVAGTGSNNTVDDKPVLQQAHPGRDIPALQESGRRG